MEANKVRMNMDGSIRAKVLQYKSDGNTLTEKWKTLKKCAEGVYYTTEEGEYGNTIHGIVFEENGVFWWSRQTLRPNELTPDNYFCQRIMENRRNFFADIEAKAANSDYIRKLEIEVMRRLGYDTAPLYASREAYLKRREEENRQEAEAFKRREQERKEAEKQRKVQLLAEVKEKLLNHEAITVEQIELIAEAVGYTIHGRTLGFMRKKVQEVRFNAVDTVSVTGRGLTKRNISGTAKAVFEIVNMIKAQAETEAQEAATATETPQIPTETAETVKCTTERETTQDAVNAQSSKYRFTQAETEEMKRQILGECVFNATALENGLKKVFPEMGEYSAANIRRSFEGYIDEFAKGSKYRKFYERQLALYESLTENDKPNFATQPPETPPKVNHTTPTAESGHSENKQRISA